MKRLEITFESWDDVRDTNKYPAGDDNGGYVYGLYLWSVDDQTGDREFVDLAWFCSEADRNQFAETLELDMVTE